MLCSPLALALQKTGAMSICRRPLKAHRAVNCSNPSMWPTGLRSADARSIPPHVTHSVANFHYARQASPRHHGKNPRGTAPASRVISQCPLPSSSTQLLHPVPLLLGVIPKVPSAQCPPRALSSKLSRPLSRSTYAARDQQSGLLQMPSVQLHLDS